MNRLVRVVTLALGMAVALSLVGCGPTQTTKDVDTDTGAAKNNANADRAFGEAAEYDGWTVTVVRTEWVAPEFDPTGKMHQINVAYENGTGAAIPTNQSEWGLEDTNGVRSRETTSRPQGLWAREAVPREIAPGAKGVYSIFFVMPQRDVARIVYKPPKSLGDVQETTWK